MISNYNKIKEYVLTLSGFEDTPKLDLQIKMIIDEVLAYCYRNDVPEIMELPLADVIVNELNTKGLMGFDGGNISSYKEGDMQVTFSGSSNSVSSTGGGKYFGKLEAFKQIIGAIKKDVQG